MADREKAKRLSKERLKCNKPKRTPKRKLERKLTTPDIMLKILILIRCLLDTGHIKLSGNYIKDQLRHHFVITYLSPEVGGRASCIVL